MSQLLTELGIALAHRGHEVHFITYRQPFRLPSFLPRVYFHEVDVGRYPLFEFPPYELALASKMTEVARLLRLRTIARTARPSNPATQIICRTTADIICAPSLRSMSCFPRDLRSRP